MHINTIKKPHKCEECLKLMTYFDSMLPQSLQSNENTICSRIEIQLAKAVRFKGMGIGCNREEDCFLKPTADKKENTNETISNFMTFYDCKSTASFANPRPLLSSFGPIPLT